MKFHIWTIQSLASAVHCVSGPIPSWRTSYQGGYVAIQDHQSQLLHTHTLQNHCLSLKFGSSYREDNACSPSGVVPMTSYICQRCLPYDFCSIKIAPTNPSRRVVYVALKKWTVRSRTDATDIFTGCADDIPIWSLFKGTFGSLDWL